MNDLPLISVLMPVLNGGKYLLHSVNSVIWQTYRNWELIILDDGSDDGAVDEIAELIQDSRVRIYKDGSNLGLSYRLNQGLLLSRGQYIARMDADDFSFRIDFRFRLII